MRRNILMLPMTFVQNVNSRKSTKGVIRNIQKNQTVKLYVAFDTILEINVDKIDDSSVDLSLELYKTFETISKENLYDA